MKKKTKNQEQEEYDKDCELKEEYYRNEGEKEEIEGRKRRAGGGREEG